MPAWYAKKNSPNLHDHLPLVRSTTNISIFMVWWTSNYICSQHIGSRCPLFSTSLSKPFMGLGITWPWYLCDPPFKIAILFIRYCLICSHITIIGLSFACRMVMLNSSERFFINTSHLGSSWKTSLHHAFVGMTANQTRTCALSALSFMLGCKWIWQQPSSSP